MNCVYSFDVNFYGDWFCWIVVAWHFMLTVLRWVVMGLYFDGDGIGFWW
jgi:hypothetical protein